MYDLLLNISLSLFFFQMSGATGRDSGFINFRSLGNSQVVIWKSEKTFMKIIKKCKVDLTKHLLIRLKKVKSLFISKGLEAIYSFFFSVYFYRLPLIVQDNSIFGLIHLYLLHLLHHVNVNNCIFNLTLLRD